MSYPFAPVSEAQYREMVSDGAHGQPSPMDDLYAAVMAGAKDAGIDPRLVCAWTKSENANATDISDSLRAARNYAGIKYVGQSRAHVSDPPLARAPANEGGVPYAEFTTDADFFYTLASNIRWVIDTQGGDLNRGAWYYTLGTPGLARAANGEQHPKTIYYEDYQTHYPSQGATPVPDTSVYGEDLIAILRTHLGETSSDGTLDPWNGAHLWEGWCQASMEGARSFAGLEVNHRVSAAVQLDLVIAQGLLQQGRPEHGGICMWGRSFDPSGHTCMWDDDKKQFISTLYGPSRLDYFYSDAWYNAMAGWWRAPGVVAARRGAQPTPPPPVVDSWFIDGNPYGPVPIKMPFWGRWDALNAMGAKLDHSGAVNPHGLALPTLGYAVEPETTLATGRRAQKFERGWLATDKGDDPFNCVVLTLSERPA